MVCFDKVTFPASKDNCKSQKKLPLCSYSVCRELLEVLQVETDGFLALFLAAKRGQHCFIKHFGKKESIWLVLSLKQSIPLKTYTTLPPSLLSFCINVFH